MSLATGPKTNSPQRAAAARREQRLRLPRPHHSGAVQNVALTRTAAERINDERQCALLLSQGIALLICHGCSNGGWRPLLRDAVAGTFPRLLCAEGVARSHDCRRGIAITPVRGRRATARRRFRSSRAAEPGDRSWGKQSSAPAGASSNRDDRMSPKGCCTARRPPTERHRPEGGACECGRRLPAVVAASGQQAPGRHSDIAAGAGGATARQARAGAPANRPSQEPGQRLRELLLAEAKRSPPRSFPFPLNPSLRSRCLSASVPRRTKGGRGVAPPGLPLPNPTGSRRVRLGQEAVVSAESVGSPGPHCAVPSSEPDIHLAMPVGHFAAGRSPRGPRGAPPPGARSQLSWAVLILLVAVRGPGVTAGSGLSR